MTVGDRAVAALLIVALVTAAVVLVETGRDPTLIAVLVSGPAVSGLLGLIVYRKTSDVETSVAQVAHQTNGTLTAALAGIQASADANGAMLTDAAADRSGTAAAPASVPESRAIAPDDSR